MRPTRLPAPRAGAGIAAALLLALAAPAAFAHPFDNEFAPPRTYTEGVHRIREIVQVLHVSSTYAGLADLTRGATILGGLATALPGLTLRDPATWPPAAADRILRASVELNDVAAAIQREAGHDSAAVNAGIARCAGLIATLDAFVPATYVCPMHCETRTYGRPGGCPVCGMHLQRVTEDRYSVEVTPEGTLRAGTPATLTFRLRDPAGFDVRDLQVVHEKLLHLMIVSHDLARFDHVHPVRGADGSFRLRHTFPAPGRYVLYHDFTPDSVGLQVVPVELVVAGPEPEPVPLVVDDRGPRRVEGCDVTLAHGPLVPGSECRLAFTLTRGGRPVTDLEPFLGAAGHLVMISEDRGSYVHSHPLETTSGPTVEFRMRFERTGLYKAWGQFQRRGRVITVPFVVDVSTDARSSDLVR